jgi:hypothetical protein
MSDIIFAFILLLHLKMGFFRKDGTTGGATKTHSTGRKEERVGLPAEWVWRVG